MREDRITEPLRNRVHARDSETLSYLVTCPWCLSVYAGALVSVGRIVAPRLTRALTRALALSAVAGTLTEREEARTDGF